MNNDKTFSDLPNNALDDDFSMINGYEQSNAIVSIDAATNSTAQENLNSIFNNDKSDEQNTLSDNSSSQ